MNLPRETIYGALFTQLKTAAGFKVVSRRVRLWDQLKSDERPALIMIEPRENYVQNATGQPQEATLHVNLLLIADVQQNRETESMPPISIINPLIDAVEAALAPSPVTWAQTLGGIVSHAWIEGEIMKDSGDLDGTAIALMSVRILVPS